MTWLKLSTKARIALGLMSLVMSVLMGALSIGLVPDSTQDRLQARCNTTISLAVQSSMLAGNRSILQAVLEQVVAHDPAIASAAIRLDDGELFAGTDNHTSVWPASQAESKPDNPDQYWQVPILKDEQAWGRLELAFTRPADTAAVWGHIPVVGPRGLLVAFTTLMSGIAFYFYLGKVLSLLNPSQAVPARVRAALDNLTEGLLVLDRRQRIVLANQAFSNIVGIAAEKLMGQKADNLPWIADDGLAFQFPWQTAIENECAIPNVILKMQDQHGVLRVFIVNSSPVLGQSGSYRGVFVSLEDVTELENSKIELKKSKETAEAASRAKSEFLANMSHEIRTPMTAVLGFTDVLRRGLARDERQQQKYLNTIYQSGNHLLTLINDILDLSKIEAGRIEIENIVCNPHHIIQEVLTVLRVRTDQKGLQLQYVPQGKLPEMILTDAAKLRQIVTNLVGNAIKFTETGGITVSTSFSQGPDGPQFLIDVQDSGVGIAPDSIAKIFQPFGQADSSITRRFGGTGLGLTISRRFAQAMGGDINVTSEVGHGSCFHVAVSTGPIKSLKFVDASEIATTDTHSTAIELTSHDLRGARVLLVDDGPENRELLTIVLTDAKAVVTTGTNGQEGVTLALASSYDVILMDMQMPIMDGYTAAGKLRQAGCKLPIVAFTAHAMKGDMEKCLAAGCSHFLTKPVNIDRLLSLVSELTGGTTEPVTPQAAARVETPSVIAESPDVTQVVLPQTPLEPIRSTLPVHDVRFAKIVCDFVDRLDAQLRAMYNALAAENYQELAALGHWLKGAGGNVGFSPLSEAALALEQAAKARDAARTQACLAQIDQLRNRLELPLAAFPASGEPSMV